MCVAKLKNNKNSVIKEEVRNNKRKTLGGTYIYTFECCGFKVVGSYLILEDILFR